jgi:hypothetical protein
MVNTAGMGGDRAARRPKDPAFEQNFSECPHVGHRMDRHREVAEDNHRMPTPSKIVDERPAPRW